MENWKDYIDLKFGKSDLFKLNEEDDGAFISIVIRSENPEIETEINFLFISADKTYSRLFDIQIDHPKRFSETPIFDLLPFCFEDDGQFSEKNIEYVEQYLDYPINRGWKEDVFFIFGKYYKSLLRHIFQIQYIQHNFLFLLKLKHCFTMTKYNHSTPFEP